MISTHPAFVTGFVKQCYHRGLSEDATVAAFALLNFEEKLAHPELTATFGKSAGGSFGGPPSWTALAKQQLAKPGEIAKYKGSASGLENKGAGPGLIEAISPARVPLRDALPEKRTLAELNHFNDYMNQFTKFPALEMILGRTPGAMSDPAPGFGVKKSADLLERIKELGTSAQTAWTNARPETRGALIGAGVGGAGGLVLGGKNRIRNALLGALAGGGAGYGIGHTDFGREMLRPRSQPMLQTGPVEVVSGADNVRKRLPAEQLPGFDSLNPGAKPPADPGSLRQLEPKAGPAQPSARVGANDLREFFNATGNLRDTTASGIGAASDLVSTVAGGSTAAQPTTR